VPAGTTLDQLNALINRVGHPTDQAITMYFNDPSGQLIGVGTREAFR
jgi:hypothetical protein